MSATTHDSHAGAPGVVRILNPVIGRLIGAGMPFGPNVLLTVRGRSSGEPRTFPVAIVRHDGRRFVQSPFGDVNWVKNLRASGEATLKKGRRVEAVAAVELTPEQAAPILRSAVAPYLRNRFLRAILGRFFKLPPDATEAELVEEARRHPTFELTTSGR